MASFYGNARNSPQAGSGGRTRPLGQFFAALAHTGQTSSDFAHSEHAELGSTPATHSRLHIGQLCLTSFLPRNSPFGE